MTKTKKCPLCAEEIKAEAIKCKHCGADLNNNKVEVQEPKKADSKPQAVKRASFIKGLGYSLAFGIVAIGIGGLLTLTVIGGIIGVPMIFIGGIAILISPLMFLAMSEGLCPYCQYEVVVMNGKKVIKCNSCKNRFSVRDGSLHRIPK